MPDEQTTDVIARIDKELAHPVMRHTGSGEVEKSLLDDSKAEIERLQWLVREALDTFGCDPDAAPLGWIERAEEALYGKQS